MGDCIIGDYIIGELYPTAEYYCFKAKGWSKAIGDIGIGVEDCDGN